MRRTSSAGRVSSAGMVHNARSARGGQCQCARTSGGGGRAGAENGWMVHYIGCALGHVTKCPAYFIAEFSLPTTAIPAYLLWSEIKPLTSDGAGEQARTARPAQAPQRSTGYGVDVMRWASFEAEKASSWTVQSAK